MAAALEILFSIRDGKGKASTTSIKIPSTTAISDAILFAKEMAKLMDPLIRGNITRIGIALTVDLPGTLAVSSQDDADVEEGVRFQFRTNGGYYTGLRLPTIDEANIVVGSDAVDEADAAVAAFINAMVSGIDLTAVGSPGVTVGPCDARDDGIVAFEFGREQFLSSRR